VNATARHAWVAAQLVLARRSHADGINFDFEEALPARSAQARRSTAAWVLSEPPVAHAHPPGGSGQGCTALGRDVAAGASRRLSVHVADGSTLLRLAQAAMYATLVVEMKEAARAALPGFQVSVDVAWSPAGIDGCVRKTLPVGSTPSSCQSSLQAGPVGPEERAWTWWAHTRGGNAPAFQQPT
jgi:hypothetical protein